MIKIFKTASVLFFLLTFFLDTHKVYASNEPLGKGKSVGLNGLLKENAHVVSLVITIIVNFGPIAYRHFVERNPEVDEVQIEAQRRLNEARYLSNRKLKQDIDFSSDSEVQDNNRKLLAAKAVLQSHPGWVSQELQIRAQAIEGQSMEQRITILQELEMVKSLKSSDSLDNKEKYDLVVSGLFNRYNKMVHGVEFVPVKIRLSGKDEDNDE